MFEQITKTQKVISNIVSMVPGLKELNVSLSESGYENGNYQRPSNKQKIANADVLFSLDIFNP